MYCTCTCGFPVMPMDKQNEHFIKAQNVISLKMLCLKHCLKPNKKVIYVNFMS